ncbi:MAG: outer membrane protein assembly factor BamD, partial [Pyrinomonadaceae bacterium]
MNDKLLSVNFGGISLLRRFAGALHGSRLVRAALCVIACAFVALGCGWAGTEHSVRFNGWLSERDMGRLPPLPFDARGGKARSGTTADEDDGKEFESWRHRVGEVDGLWRKAGELAAGGDLTQARKALDDYLAAADDDRCGDTHWSITGECSQQRRNSAVDQLDALGNGAAESAAARAYLNARRAYDAWLMGTVVKAAAPKMHSSPRYGYDGREIKSDEVVKETSAEEVWRALDAVPRGRDLDDNVAYLRAAVLYREDEKAEAVEAFKQLAARFPRSEKREAALYMAGVVEMKLSRSYTGEYATADGACPQCRDEAWVAARDSFTRLLREFPRGRYAPDARGWLAYLALRVGDTAGGLLEYYRLLSAETDERRRREAVTSLCLSRDKAGDHDLDKIEAALEREPPQVALTYAYHNIYNYALRHGVYVEIHEEDNPYRHAKNNSTSGYHQESYEWEQKERERLSGIAERKELKRVAAFATRLMLRHPRAGVGGGFALRVAQADLELGEDKSARELARRALSLGVAGDERAAALWVRGVAEQRLRDFGAARQTFSALVAEFPGGDLTEGARRQLAMAAEDAGDLDAA